MTPFDLDFAEVNAAALRLYPGLLYQWFPGGVLHGEEYDVLNPTRDDYAKGSFRINIVSGEWADFATNQRGTTPITLYAEFFCDEHNSKDAAKQIARQIGMLDDVPADPRIAQMIEHLKATPKPDSMDAGWEQVPAPDDAPLPPIKDNYPTWSYFTVDGQRLGYISRKIKSDGKKWYSPQTWWRRTEDGFGEWRGRQFTRPLPIYNVLALAKQPTWPVLVVEGEKATEAGIKWFEQYVTVSWPGGASAADYVDWRPLAGRRVCLLPDNDEPGRKAMREISAKLVGIAAGVWTLEVEAHRPVGWDIADGSWASKDAAAAWLEGLAQVDVKGTKDQAAAAVPMTIKQERIEQAIARANSKIVQYEVVPEKAIFEPFPVPALQGMADWIESQVGISGLVQYNY